MVKTWASGAIPYRATVRGWESRCWESRCWEPVAFTGDGTAPFDAKVLMFPTDSDNNEEGKWPNSWTLELTPNVSGAVLVNVVVNYFHEGRNNGGSEATALIRGRGAKIGPRSLDLGDYDKFDRIDFEIKTYEPAPGAITRITTQQLDTPTELTNGITIQPLWKHCAFVRTDPWDYQDDADALVFQYFVAMLGDAGASLGAHSIDVRIKGDVVETVPADCYLYRRKMPGWCVHRLSGLPSQELTDDAKALALRLHRGAGPGANGRCRLLLVDWKH